MFGCAAVGSCSGEGPRGAQRWVESQSDEACARRRQSMQQQQQARRLVVEGVTEVGHV